MKKSIFISYRRDENPWAVARLRERLYGEFGKSRVFFDNEAIHAGERWPDRLAEAMKEAGVVVMVHGKAWHGPLPDGRRRIDDEGDWVRRELAEAHALGAAIVPVMIDDAPAPTVDGLPAALRFLPERQFKQLDHRGSLDAQIDGLIFDVRRALYGRTPFVHYLLQAGWIGLVAVSLVWLARSAGLLALPEDAMARTAQYLLAQRGPFEPGGYAVVEIDDEEYRELFGGRTPLDPEVMTIFVEALLDASGAQGRCGGSRQAAAPVGFNVDLSPGEAGANDERYEALAMALRRLSACRPTVIACPQSVETGDPPDGDLRWLRLLTHEDAAAGRPVTLASTTLDSHLLRPSAKRHELGVVLGDLAAGRGAATDDAAAADCACPWRAEAARHCEGVGAGQAALDASGLVVPFRARRYRFSESLLQMPQVGTEPVVIVGGGFGTQGRFAVAALPGFQRGASGAMANAFLARSVREKPVAPSRGALAAADLVVALAASAALMLLWRRIAARSQRYALRALDYAGVIAVFAGVPLACVLVAVQEPRLLPWASSAAIVALATGLRSAMSGYEMLLNGGVAWNSPPGLLRKALDDRIDRASALARFGVAALETLLIAGAAGVLLLG